MRTDRWLGAGLILLGLAIAVSTLLGPLALDVIRYRTSDTMLNQLLGADAAGLFVVAPVSLIAGALVLRGHRAAPVLALAPSMFAAYTYAQVITGEEYLREPGNVERFFPLLLGVFVLAGAVAVRAWAAVDGADLPATPRRSARFAAGVLFFCVAFLVMGIHLPSYLDAIRDHPTRVEYVASPTPFFIVKLMDLGIIVPVALVVGAGLLRGLPSARKPMHAIIGGFTLLATSVTAMATVMYVNDDPDSSLGMVAGTGVLTLLFAALAAHLYRPLFASVSSTAARG